MKKLLLPFAILISSCGGPTDVVVGEDYRRVHDPLVTPTTALDVLFIVDASGSMQAEQAALVAAAGQQLFAQLQTDLGGPPDLHVAVVSTDVGVGIPDVPGCPAESYDGRFRTGADGVTCPIDGRYLIDEADGAGGRTTNYTGSFVDAFACAATLGTLGCGFEQPLEAMRRALDGRYPEHAGFLRNDALLLIVFLTDEDDCSASDPAIYGDPAATVTSPLGPRTSFRCFEFGVVCDPDEPRTAGEKAGCVSREDSAYIAPVGPYADFLRALKPDPAMVMLAGMYGPLGPVVVGEGVLAPEGYPSLMPTCAAAGTGVEALPPIRLAGLADEFQSRFVFESLCDSVMSERLYRVTRSTSGVMSQRPCLLGDLGTATTTERCRAFDVAGATSTPLQRCGNGAVTNCFSVATSAQCDYTPSGLGATYRGSLAAGHRLVVECLAKVE